MEVKTFELEVDLINERNYKVNYEIDGILISSKEINKGIKKMVYRIDKDFVKIQKEWQFDYYEENYFEKGKYSIIFRRKWNNLYGFYENKLEPAKVEFLEYKREDIPVGYKEVENFKWNNTEVYYSYTKYNNEDVDEEVTILKNHEARKKIFEIIKDWTYIIS